MACPGWPLLVSLPDPPGTPLEICPTMITIPLASSWEFVTTLNYEWSTIRGRRPYRWTIWVRYDAHFLSGFVIRPRNLASSTLFRRSILSRAHLLLWP